MGRYSTFKLDFFCVGSELDIDTGWGGDQVLEFRRSQISKEHLNDRGKGLQGFSAKSVTEA